MSVDAVNKKELFRLMSTKWRRRNTQRRWEYMCELHDAGANWAAMGHAIDRHYTTAKKLWKRGQLERQKKMAAKAGFAPADRLLQRQLH